MPCKTEHFRQFHRRAKEKRLKKDAGRARWGQFFRNGSSGTTNNKEGGRSSKIEDVKDELALNFSAGKLFYFTSRSSNCRVIKKEKQLRIAKRVV